MHRLPELPLLTSRHHLLPAHRVIPGMGLTGHREESISPPCSYSEKERSRGEPGTGVGKHKPSAQAGLRSATRGLPGSILNAVWQIYAG